MKNICNNFALLINLQSIKLTLHYDRSLIETAMQFREETEKVLDYGFENKTFDKNDINKGTYRTVRDTASEVLNVTKLKKIKKKSLTIIYDNRTFKFYSHSHIASIIIFLDDRQYIF